MAPVPPVAIIRHLDALWVGEREGKGQPTPGGVTRIRASVKRNVVPTVGVGVVEGISSGTGSTWRASVWIAAVMSSFALGRDVSEHRFLISTAGRIDGPSGGALMTAGFLSAITGAPVKPGATITGGLGPDGSVLPVGGVPEKVAAAARVGIKVVGIPAGQRRSKRGDGQMVDVVALGKSLGVVVREVADLWEAYALLTGRRLPLTRPLSRARMGATGALEQRLAKRTADWLTRAHKLRQGLARRALPQALRVRFDRATKRLARVAATAAQGGLTAYFEALGANAYLQAIDWVLRWRRGAGRDPLGACGAVIKPVKARLAQVLARPGARPLRWLGAFMALARSQGYLDSARKQLVDLQDDYKLPRLDGAALRRIGREKVAYLPAIFLSLSRLSAEMAADFLQPPAAAARASRITFVPRRFDRVARSLVAAAQANVEFVDALLLEEAAEEHNVPLSRMRYAFAQREPSYFLARKLGELAAAYTEDTKSSVADAFMRLAAAISSYVASARVVTKYYSLDAAIDGSHPARRPKGLAALLRYAERAARGSAGSLFRRFGVLLPSAQFYYVAGVRLQQGKRRSLRLRALTHFWTAALLSRVAQIVLTTRPTAR